MAGKGGGRGGWMDIERKPKEGTGERNGGGGGGGGGGGSGLISNVI